MYFSAFDIDDVPHGWIRGKCQRGDMYETAYKWLSQYCDFFPPVWVSDDQNKLTGYSFNSKKALFGFNRLSGFPVKYDPWTTILGILINLDTNNFRLIDERLVEDLNSFDEDEVPGWSSSRTLDDYLRSFVFVNFDQFAVRSLDLRRSDVILCNDEAQRSILGKKGFPSSKIKVSSSYSRFFKVQ